MLDPRDIATNFVFKVHKEHYTHIDPWQKRLIWCCKAGSGELKQLKKKLKTHRVRVW